MYKICTKKFRFFGGREKEEVEVESYFFQGQLAWLDQSEIGQFHIWDVKGPIATSLDLDGLRAAAARLLVAWLTDFDDLHFLSRYFFCFLIILVF